MLKMLHSETLEGWKTLLGFFITGRVEIIIDKYFQGPDPRTQGDE